MQREIKFRGKRVDGQGWVYGTYHYSADGKYHYILAREKFIDFEDMPIRYLHKPEVWIVLPESVGQYTGLNDKNGGECYLFDIVNVTNKGIYNGPKVIVWDEILLCHVFVWADQFKTWVNSSAGTTYLKVSTGIKCEIIGNTIDNPELIKP